MERRTGRWEVGLLAAVVTGGVGALAGNTTLVLAATVGLTFAAYGYATRPPSTNVSVERTLSTATADPGETVRVSLEVRNDGDEAVPDLRLLDAPPRDLSVVEGAPSLATSLEPGETETAEYALAATRGDHEFGDPVVATRSVDGGTERRWTVDTDHALTVTSVLDSFPPADATVDYTGRVPTDRGGPGVEFHSVREYHPEDPPNRVDWNRFARTGQLRTIDFREHRAARVLVLVDERGGAERVREAGEADTVELGREAAGQIVDALLSWNNLVGVARMDTHIEYLEPDVGDAQRHRLRELLDDDVATPEHADRLAVLSDGPQKYVERLNGRLSESTQVVFVSPLLDDDAPAVAAGVRAHGHPVTVVTPDVTTAETPGGTVARIRRARRVESVREGGTRVVDWPVDEPLYTAVERAKRGWSA